MKYFQIGGGTSMAKHSHALLVKAGMAIAPDSFAESIGSVSPDNSKSGYDPPTVDLTCM